MAPTQGCCGWHGCKIVRQARHVQRPSMTTVNDKKRIRKEEATLTTSAPHPTYKYCSPGKRWRQLDVRIKPLLRRTSLHAHGQHHSVNQQSAVHGRDARRNLARQIRDGRLVASHLVVNQCASERRKASRRALCASTISIGQPATTTVRHTLIAGSASKSRVAHAHVAHTSSVAVAAVGAHCSTMVRQSGHVPAAWLTGRGRRCHSHAHAGCGRGRGARKAERLGRRHQRRSCVKLTSQSRLMHIVAYQQHM